MTVRIDFAKTLLFLNGFPNVGGNVAPGATIVGLWAWGGQSRCHDYLMDDGTIATLFDREADLYRKPPVPA